MRRGRWLATVLAASVLAAACGNSGDDTSDGTEPGTTVATEPGATTTTADLSTNNPVDEKGVSDTEITFTSISTITNNVLGTDIGNAFNDGIEGYFEWRNSQGGVWGRDLVLGEKRDDQLGLNQQAAQEMVAQDDSFGAFVATLQFTGADVLNDAGVPTFGWNIHPQFADRPAIYGHTAPLCLGCSGKYMPYLAKSVGATKVALLGYSVENSAKCVDGLEDSFELYGAEAGAEVVFSDNTLAYGLPGGVAPQVSAMKEAGVDFITTCMDLNAMKTLAEELEKQGMGDVVMHHPNTYNQDFVAANADLFEGDIVVTLFAPFEYEVGEQQDAFFEYTDDSTRGELTMIGWIAADIAYTGLVKAGPDFDRAKVIAALNATTDYTAGGFVAPIDWSRQHPDPVTNPDAASDQSCFSPVRIVDGEFEPYLAPIDKPFLCMDNTTEELGEPVATSFAPEG